MGIIGTLKSKSFNDVLNHFKVKKSVKQGLAQRQLIIDDYLKANEIVKLQLGCGKCPIEGWLNTDLAFNEKVAYLDASRTFPFKDNSVNYIFCEHLFEHLDFSQEMNLLKESYRILKPEGVLRITMPNLDFLFNLKVSNNAVEREYVNVATNSLWNLKDVKSTFSPDEFNEVFVINNFFKDWGHQIIHNYSSIELMLKKVGFKEVRLMKNGKSEIPELDNLEQHSKIISEDFNLLESFTVEANKQN